MNTRSLYSLAALCLVAALLTAQTKRTPEITAAELQLHIKYLASDELEGRLAGSPGAEKAANYIASEFKSYGLVPLGGNGTYFQQFEFVAGVKLGPDNTCAVSEGNKESVLSVNRDFRPLGFSSNGTYAGGIVFAGYGISAPEKGYDDYQGIDVKDKAVIILRYSPTPDSGRDEFEQYSSLRYKASRARELGARAILVVTGPVDSDKDDLVKLTYDQVTGNAGIVSMNLTRTSADRILKSQNTTIEDLQRAIVKTRKPHSMVVPGVTLRLQSSIEEVKKKSANVIGLLKGSDRVLKNEVVVLGAHYDHLGYGGEGSGSLLPDTVAIHHGADDNASGTAGLLELAQWFAGARNELKRSILFISFTGEEEGVLGSAYYVRNPGVPLERTVAMVNLDMVGRLHDRRLIVYGTGTSQGFDSLILRHNSDSTFALSLVRDGFGPSDQSSFYAKQIPVFFFFTDLHGDYHRPSDTWDKINYPGEAQVVCMVRDVALDLDQTSTRPRYLAVEMPKPAGNAGRGYRVSVGTIPDFGEQVEGYKLGGVREGSPAAKAGLRAGDIIVKFGRIDIKSLYDFTYALGEYKPGDEVDVVIKRGDETINTKVMLEKRN